MNSKLILTTIVLKTLDIEKSRGFYERLGLQFEKHSHGNGPVHYACKEQNILFEIYPAKEKLTNHMSLGFGTPDLVELRSKLIETAIPCSDIVDSEYGTLFTLRDPDDNRVEIYQF